MHSRAFLKLAEACQVWTVWTQPMRSKWLLRPQAKPVVGFYPVLGIYLFICANHTHLGFRRRHRTATLISEPINDCGGIHTSDISNDLRFDFCGAQSSCRSQYIVGEQRRNWDYEKAIVITAHYAARIKFELGYIFAKSEWCVWIKTVEQNRANRCTYTCAMIYADAPRFSSVLEIDRAGDRLRGLSA